MIAAFVEKPLNQEVQHIINLHSILFAVEESTNSELKKVLPVEISWCEEGKFSLNNYGKWKLVHYFDFCESVILRHARNTSSSIELKILCVHVGRLKV